MENSFFEAQSTIKIAQQLLGKTLCHQTSKGTYRGLIVETEAYLGRQDLAAHAANGHPTKKTAALYTGSSRIYVYQMRGLYLLNFTTQIKAPECVLIRGIEPVDNIAQMIQNRQGRAGRELTNGPGKLCQAIDLHTLQYNGQVLGTVPLSVDLQTFETPKSICNTTRIGVPNKGKWTEAKLRFYVAQNPYVSKISKKTIDFQTRGWQQK